MSSLTELRTRVQDLQANEQELKGREKAAEEEVSKVKKEILEAGFKNVGQLKAAMQKAETERDEFKTELEELLAPFEAA